MPQYLAPGVYVEEVPSAIRPIAGVGTSTAGFIGAVADNVTMPLMPGRTGLKGNNQRQPDDFYRWPRPGCRSWSPAGRSSAPASATSRPATSPWRTRSTASSTTAAPAAA